MIMEGAGVFLYWFWESHPCPWNDARCHLRSQSGCGKGQGRFVLDALVAHCSHGYLPVALCTDDAPSSSAAQHRPCWGAEWGAGEQSGVLGSSVGCWGAEWGAGEHKAGAGMSVEPLVYNSYLYSCGKSVLLGSYSVHLKIKIGILIEYVVLLWIYVFYLRQFAFSCSSDLEGIVIAWYNWSVDMDCLGGGVFT